MKPERIEDKLKKLGELFERPELGENERALAGEIGSDICHELRRWRKENVSQYRFAIASLLTDRYGPNPNGKGVFYWVMSSLICMEDSLRQEEEEERQALLLAVEFDLKGLLETIRDEAPYLDDLRKIIASNNELMTKLMKEAVYTVDNLICGLLNGYLIEKFVPKGRVHITIRGETLIKRVRNIEKLPGDPRETIVRLLKDGALLASAFDK
jgi:hypothetical protein